MPLSPEDVTRSRARLDHIINSLPKDCTLNEALNGLLSAYLTVGVRSSQTPALITALRASVRMLEIGYESGSTSTQAEPTLEDLRKTDLEIGEALVNKFAAAVPAGTPHNLEMVALLARFAGLAEANPCCLQLCVDLAQDTVDRLKSGIDHQPAASHLTH